MEPIMHSICKDLSIDIRRRKKANGVLRKKVTVVEKGLKEDELFRKLFTNNFFYGGSFYDNLKIRSPDEFDLDILLKFEEKSVPNLDHTNKPGFVSVKIKNPDALSIAEKALLTDDNYLSTSKVRSWMQSIVARYVDNYSHRQNANKYKLSVKDTVKQSGPAITIHVTDNDDFGIDIDFVPCFVFTSWPEGGYRQNPTNIGSFFIVPQPVHPKFDHSDRYWRISFQQQERKLIHDKNLLKPTCRLLKALRDRFDQKEIASYFIKTIFLWVDSEKKLDFWRRHSQAQTFLTMLDYYISYIEVGNIPNFWNKNHNMLSNVSDVTLSQYVAELKHFKNIFLTEPGRIKEFF